MPVTEAVLRLKLAPKEQLEAAVADRRTLANSDKPVPALIDHLVNAGVIKAADKPKLVDYRLVKYYQNRIPGYEIRSVIGHGSGGIVYLANQVMLDRLVAVKVLRYDLAANPMFRQRFLTEARAAARLSHTNIVSCYDAGDVGTSSYMVLEYVDGRTVAELVRDRGPLDARLALQVTRDVAEALRHAEKFNIVHRDIKPENIMLSRDRRGKLLDLGLARGEWKDDIAVGMAVGTPNYMSPEQALGDATIDHRADYYSLGATLFYMVVGSSPFLGTPEQVMFKHVNSPPPLPNSLRPDVPQTVSGLILRLLSKRREDRPANGDELLMLIDQSVTALDAAAIATATANLAPAPRPVMGPMRPGPGLVRPAMPSGPMPPGPPLPPGPPEPRLPKQRRRPPIRRGGW